jgi:alkaline phosphatase
MHRNGRIMTRIALGLIESGAQVILGGGEKHFLPKDAKGVHGPGARKEDKNLVELARERRYTVVFTRRELLSLPESNHTFNDRRRKSWPRRSCRCTGRTRRRWRR